MQNLPIFGTVTNLLQLTALAFLTFQPAPAPPPPVVIDTQVSLRDFVMSEGNLAGPPPSPDAANPPANTLLEIPSIFVYSPKGELLYHGTSSMKEQTLKLLEGMPDTAKALPPQKSGPVLSSMLDIVPDYKKRQQEILKDGHYVVYAVTMNEAAPTGTQRAIAALRARGNDLPIDTLLIRLQR